MLSISAIIPTAGRSASLFTTLQSLAKQELHPREIIIIDASADDETRHLCDRGVEGLRSSIRWVRSQFRGAAIQRNEGYRHATQPTIWFFDDDVLFEPNCIERLWNVLDQDRQLGGVNAMITNQSYHPPGFVSRTMFTLMHGQREKNFAGKVIGPAINLLPEDRQDLPEVVTVEWLNTTCTMYRREALPTPVFDEVFTGYSLMEDLALSLRVAQAGWKLANVRTALIFHDSQPGRHKKDAADIAEMELRNRAYVMTEILGRRGVCDYIRLILWECFAVISSLASGKTIREVSGIAASKFRAFAYCRNEAGKKAGES
jgi:GT2 family glycosyltransferase